MENIKYNVGVIVARFQVSQLTPAHIALLETVRQKHKKIILFLGISPVIASISNPLDFEMRKQMVTEIFPDVLVLAIKDVNSDEEWSYKLDGEIWNLLTPTQIAIIYGGRDSFIQHYTGGFAIKEIESIEKISGTAHRLEIGSEVRNSPDFRSGVIWTAYNRYPYVQSTVDAIITDKERGYLLVRKNNERLFRFVGGYTQTNTESFEEDIVREINEEVGVAVTTPKYLGSMKVDDWRYRSSLDKIKTLIFEAPYMFGAIKVQDRKEIAEGRWFKELEEHLIVPEHRPIFKKFIKGEQV